MSKKTKAQLEEELSELRQQMSAMMQIIANSGTHQQTRDSDDEHAVEVTSCCRGNFNVTDGKKFYSIGQGKSLSLPYNKCLAIAEHMPTLFDSGQVKVTDEKLTKRLELENQGKIRTLEELNNMLDNEPIDTLRTAYNALLQWQQ